MNDRSQAQIAGRTRVPSATSFKRSGQIAPGFVQKCDVAPIIANRPIIKRHLIEKLPSHQRFYPPGVNDHYGYHCDIFIDSCPQLQLHDQK